MTLFANAVTGSKKLPKTKTALCGRRFLNKKSLSGFFYFIINPVEELLLDIR